MKPRIVPFGIKEVDGDSLNRGSDELPQASGQPVNNVPPTLPIRGNTWTNYLQGAEGVERHKVAVELSKRYLDCDLTSEEVEFFLTDYARRCSPQMEPHEIHQIISNIPRNEAPQFLDTVPWPDALRVDDVLNEIVSFLQRFSIISKDAAIAIALWIVHVWCLDAFQISPLLRINVSGLRFSLSFPQ